jgi:hypothetical protein
MEASFAQEKTEARQEAVLFSVGSVFSCKAIFGALVFLG